MYARYLPAILFPCFLVLLLPALARGQAAAGLCEAQFVSTPDFKVSWPEPTPNTVDHYEVHVSRDGGPFNPEISFNAEGVATIDIGHFEVVTAKVLPIDESGAPGQFSEVTAPVRGFDTSLVTQLASGINNFLIILPVDANTIQIQTLGGPVWHCTTTTVYPVDNASYTDLGACVLQ